MLSSSFSSASTTSSAPATSSTSSSSSSSARRGRKRGRSSGHENDDNAAAASADETSEQHIRTNRRRSQRHTSSSSSSFSSSSSCSSSSSSSCSSPASSSSSSTCSAMVVCGAAKLSPTATQSNSSSSSRESTACSSSSSTLPPNSCKNLHACFAYLFLGCFIPYPVADRRGIKSSVLDLIGRTTACSASSLTHSSALTSVRFNRYSGLLEFKNALILFVNVKGMYYENEWKIVEENGRNRCFMKWFASPSQQIHTSIIQRLLSITQARTSSSSAASAAAAGAEADAVGAHCLNGVDSVHLFCRWENPARGQRTSYCYCGELGYASHDESTRPIQFEFELIDYDRKFPQKDKEKEKAGEGSHRSLKELPWFSMFLQMDEADAQEEKENEFDEADEEEPKKGKAKRKRGNAAGSRTGLKK